MAEKMQLTLGHSPDPDDAFMFYGLATGQLDSGPYEFTHILQDIQTLNERCMRQELDITAISLHAYPFVSANYALMGCGCSMGDNYGPMIVARKPMDLAALKKCHIAIPGKLTTAFLGLQLLLGKDLTVSVHPFDEILNVVARGEADAGLIIHEGQLTFQNQGLVCCVDLGQWWMKETGLPMPLGGNVIRRSLGADHVRAVTKIVRTSIEFSLAQREKAVRHSLQYARDMNEGLADKFVGMYVNKWTIDYGPRGRAAVNKLMDAGAAIGVIPQCTPVAFVD